MKLLERIKWKLGIHPWLDNSTLKHAKKDIKSIKKDIKKRGHEYPPGTIGHELHETFKKRRTPNDR
jgi:hypothetical protein